MARIFIDTNIFIYALEGKGILKEKSLMLLRKINKEKLKAFTSVITIEEILVKVFERKLDKELDRYIEFISGAGAISIIEIDYDIAIMSAKLRAVYKKKGYRLKTPDAMQLAAGLLNKSEIFYTADKRLPRKIQDMKIKLITFH